MSAWLDYSTGGEAGYTGVSPTVSPAAVSSGGDWTSGLLQAVTTLGTGYLSKRMDIDLMSRVQGNMPMPGYYAGSPALSGYPLAGNGVRGATAGGGLMQLLPWALGAVAVFVIVRKVAQ